jgi:hypothetical protein
MGKFKKQAIGSMVQAVEHLLYKCEEALNSNSSSTNKIK